MESLFKESLITNVSQWLNGIIETKWQTFTVLGRIHPFLFLTISNDLDLTALFKYPSFGRK